MKTTDVLRIARLMAWGYSALLCGAAISGCAIHRQPKLTAAQKMLLHTPAHTSQAPTPRPEDF